MPTNKCKELIQKLEGLRNSTVFCEVAIPNAPPGQTGVVEAILSRSWNHSEGEEAESEQEPSS